MLWEVQGLREEVIGMLEKKKVIGKQRNSRMRIVCGMDNPIGLKAQFYNMEDGSTVYRCRNSALMEKTSPSSDASSVPPMRFASSQAMVSPSPVEVSLRAGSAL